MNKYVLIFGLILLPILVNAQKRYREHPGNEPRNKGKAILFHIAAGFHLPGADMAKRFGSDGSIGGAIEFISANNWTFGLDGHYFFGGKVKENPLSNLQTAEGYIIGTDRNPAIFYLQERGLYLGGRVGRLFPIGERRTGIYTSLGAGMLRHKIRYQDDSRTIAQITGEYAKGYDRLTGGLSLQEFVGWQHMGPTRRFNFVIGFEFQQGFTNTLRDWDFKERRKLDARRLDLRIGLRAAWILPLYFTKSRDIYY
jgi:hypothetical protein